MIKGTFIERIESELLSTLLNYIVPSVNKKIKKWQVYEDNLERIIHNTKPKINFKDVEELESILARNLPQNAKLSKKTELASGIMVQSITLVKRKSITEKSNKYSISIKYDENSKEERLNVKIRKSEKEIYSAEIVDKKEIKDKVAPYSINISYHDNYGEERLSIVYRRQLKNYIQQHINSREDMSNRVPLKWLNILPETQMGGVLGFTYLGENFMGRRADLTGKTARMVDIHESIHTPDEYETRVLTDWIMTKTKIKYIM